MSKRCPGSVPLRGDRSRVHIAKDVPIERHSPMPKRPLRFWALSALSCWLTLLASADDFNLARVLLPPSASESEGLLPLDDPNSDFTESSQSPVPTTTS